MTKMPRPPLTEHGLEPVPGLPEALPKGERLLWQGAPHWGAVARHVFLVRWVAGYFGLLLILEMAQAFTTETSLVQLAGAMGRLLLAAGLSLAILSILAKLIARSSVYSITNRRLVLRVGVALPISINIPFIAIEGADLVRRRDNAGDIILSLAPRHRISWLALWPHAHGFSFGRPRPMLRGLENAQQVAEILGKAVAEANLGQNTQLTTIIDANVAQPQPAMA